MATLLTLLSKIVRELKMLLTVRPEYKLGHQFGQVDFVFLQTQWINEVLLNML